MLFRPAGIAESLRIEIRRELPASWPSASAPGEAICYIFQTREFLEAWIASFGARRRYSQFYVEVQDDLGRLAMLLPLVIETRRGVRTLTFIDQGHADYNAPVVFPQAATDLAGSALQLWERIVSLLPAFDVVRLEKMPERILGVPNPLYGLAREANGQSCHGNDLTGALADIERVLRSPKELRSKQKALEKIAPVRFVIADDADTRGRVLEALIVQKQRRFEQTRVPGFAENPDALRFLRRATDAFAKSGNLFMCALMVGDEVAAVQWGLVQGRMLYALMTSFADGPWTKFSCGRILNYRLLQWLKAEGFTYFDQGFGDEIYKLQNSDTTVPLYRLVNGRTRLGLHYLRLQALGKRLQASPQWEALRQFKWVVLRGMRRSAATTAAHQSQQTSIDRGRA